MKLIKIEKGHHEVWSGGKRIGEVYLRPSDNGKRWIIKGYNGELGAFPDQCYYSKKEAAAVVDGIYCYTGEELGEDYTIIEDDDTPYELSFKEISTKDLP